MSKHIFAFGFEMTEKEEIELDERLKEDILQRYNNNEYWDQKIIEAFAYENKLMRR